LSSLTFEDRTLGCLLDSGKRVICSEKRVEITLNNSRRECFSGDEENHLVEYIADVNPEKRGRSGNKIYKCLVENVRSLTSLLA
jgi:hypothetical protein